MNFEIDDVMNDTVMGIPREELETLLTQNDMEGENVMNYQAAYKKLREAKVEALANSTNIKVGQRELSKALEALENMEKLRNVYEKILEMQRETDLWDKEEYERVLELLGPLVEND